MLPRGRFFGETALPSIAEHQQSPQIGIERHIGERCQSLANNLVNKKAIYLDVNFWIEIRKALDGTSTDPNAKQLAHYLRQGVERGKLFCPVSLTVFEELCGIGGESKRTATTEIIQELSAGVTLMPEPDRVEAEIESLAYTIFFPAMKQLPPRVWTRLSYIFGNIYPANIGFADETEIAIQKAFFDHMIGTCR